MMSGSSSPLIADPGQEAGFEQLRVQRSEHVTQRIVTRDATFIAVEASENARCSAPERRLHEVARAGNRRCRNQKQNFWQWIRDLGVLSRIRRRGEVIQQRDADLADHGKASIDEVSYKSNFQPRRKLPFSFKRLPCIGVGCLSDDRSFGLGAAMFANCQARQFQVTRDRTNTLLADQMTALDLGNHSHKQHPRFSSPNAG
jgi:hypothetical protein